MGRGSAVCSAMSNSGCRGWRKCQCALDSPVQGSGNATLRQRWIAPELECVQSELAAVLPYARSAELLSKLLPIGAGNSASTVRARTLHVGQRLESELTAAPVKPPRSRMPQPHVTTVGLDGGYVRHCDPAAGHSFEIIAGRLLADDGAQSSVGFVRTVVRGYSEPLPNRARAAIT
jgi:hypothetical protein